MIASKKHIDNGEAALARLLALANGTEDNIQEIAKNQERINVSDLTREQFDRYFEILERVPGKVFSAIENDWNATQLVADGAHCATGFSMTDFDRDVARRAEKVAYMALCAKSIITNRAMLREFREDA